jgi:DNA-binding NarL/FixJ family response regulator
MADDRDAVRILMTGDQPVIRTAVARLIASEPGMDVVGECFNRHDALEAAMRANPDVVVMDLDLGARANPDAVAQLLAAARRCPVLILTGNDDPQGLASALGNGALGVVLKNRPAEVLMRAIRAVRAGEAWLERSTVASAFRVNAPEHEPVKETRLTRRESEVVALVSMGLKNRKIAEILFISETTVRHHLTSIFNKLSVANRMELMRYMYTEKQG